ncbi:MAG TPA: plasmid pRiA4b ORF-3 family protein [Longimicrobium sp.]|jgi:hypothetical protein
MAIEPTFQLRVTLLGTEPPIWRQLHVRATITLEALHHVIQASMGWADDHLHQFTAGAKRYGPVEPGGLRVHDERKALLYRVLTKPGQRMLYVYDFGDDWVHEVRVEAIVRPEQPLEFPVCTAGERACPPEDCGGIWGYDDLLEVLGNPEHEEYEERREWMGDDFDPEVFDREEVNRTLRKIF